jgi:glycosyltransferase involved in cell wall biosynthesis
LKIAILGTRGIPNNYGGFEQFAQFLSIGLIERGFKVFVYSPHNHQFKENLWNGVNIIHRFDPEYRIGTTGQFIYDLNCIIDSRKRNFDLILQLGYTSSSVWSFLFKKPAIIVTNMDGLEWKRTKYGKWTQKFLKVAEKLAVKKSDFLVSDSIGIQKFIKEKYATDSVFIPYGATVFSQPDPSFLKTYDLEPYRYNMLIARLEPENSIEMILDGVQHAEDKKKMIIVGKFNTKYGEYLVQKYKNASNIIFLGSYYDLSGLNNLRYFSNLYFHGHTVGGTNPSLLEAMASHALVVANKNEFNLSILENDAYYFSNSNDVKLVLETVQKDENELQKINSNLEKINTLYSWQKIIDSYYSLFVESQKSRLSDFRKRIG